MQAEPDTKNLPPQARKEILEISPYHQGKSVIPGKEDPIKLSSNESSFGPCPAAIEAYRSVADSLHRYPDGSQTELKEAIAKVYELDAGMIICGNGSDELLDLVSRCYLSPGDEIILSASHFVMCALYAKMQGASIKFAEEDNYVTNVDDLLGKITSRTRMVTLANPNNPTGTYLNSGQIRKIHDGLPSDVLLVIDGAYGEYVSHDDYENGTKLVEENENVIITHTFSKIYGLSALRIGWAYCPVSIIEVLQRVRSPFNTNSAAMAAATAAVRDTDYIEKIRQHTARWLKKLEHELGSLGITVVPSAANFYLLDFNGCEGKSAAEAAGYLESRSIIPRLLAVNAGKEMLRITVGLDSENEAVLRALADYMA